MIPPELLKVQWHIKSLLEELGRGIIIRHLKLTEVISEQSEELFISFEMCAVDLDDN